MLGSEYQADIPKFFINDGGKNGNKYLIINLKYKFIIKILNYLNFN